MILKSFFLFFVFLAALSRPFDAAAQSNAMPDFKMLQTNGSFYSAADLPKGKPVVLIYFAPDCDHCQVLLTALFKKIKAFKNTQIVLVTFKPVSDLPLFEHNYNIANYSNIEVGTEGNTYYLRQFYKLQNTPFTALYDKNKKLVCSYRKDPSVDDLIMQVNRLK